MLIPKRTTTFIKNIEEQVKKDQFLNAAYEAAELVQVLLLNSLSSKPKEPVVETVGDPYCLPDEEGHIHCDHCREHQQTTEPREERGIWQVASEEQMFLLEDLAEAVGAWHTKVDELEIHVDSCSQMDDHTKVQCKRIIRGLQRRMKMYSTLLSTPTKASQDLAFLTRLRLQRDGDKDHDRRGCYGTGAIGSHERDKG